MISLNKKKLAMSKDMIFDGDELYWLLVAVAIVFGMLVMNKEYIFKYTVNAHQLCYEEQYELFFSDVSIDCANVVETLEKVIFIPEKNMETQEVSRYLMLIKYSVINNSGEGQVFDILHAGKNGVQINGVYHNIEEAKQIDLDKSISGTEVWTEEIPANSKMENLYYAVWIYKSYSEKEYYICDSIGKGDTVTTLIGIRNTQTEEGVILSLTMP